MLNFKKIDFELYNNNWEAEQNVLLKNPIEGLYKSYGTLHNEIKKRTKTIPINNEDLFEIILLIQKWGGSTGRYFFIKRNGVSYFEELKKSKDLIQIYLNATKLAMKGEPQSFSEFCKIPGIKESFAGKHAYFWSTNAKPLIIVDKLLSEYFGHQTPKALIDECNGYAKLIEIFYEKCTDFNLKSILVLERGIFQYTRELSRVR